MAKANKRQAIGRGLSALLKNNENQPENRREGNVLEIPIHQIDFNPNQPRKKFNVELISELAVSIKELGLIQPITVRKINSNKYQIIAGERRFKAAKTIGLNHIPCYIKSADDKQSVEMALVENIQRSDLDPIEIAMCCDKIINETKLTQDELSVRIGKKRTTITNYLRLLKLNPIIQSGIRDGFITMGHGRALLSFENKEDQLNLYKKILKKSLSVREVESLTTKKPSKNNKTVNIELPLNFSNELIKLKKYINNKVNIKLKNKERGTIIFPFNNIEEFKTIIKKLNAKK